MSITPLGIAGAGAPGNNANLQLATITSVNLFTAEVLCQIDGADTVCKVRPDAARRNFPATVGDRILVARQGSEMYEISCVQSAYAFYYPKPPYASYGITADQSLSNNSTVQILFNTALETSVVFSAPTFGIFTIPLDGVYSIIGRVSFDGVAAASTRRFAAFSINSVTQERVEMASPNQANQWVVQIADVRPLVAGDLVGLQAFQLSGGALNAKAFDPSSKPATLIRIAKVS